MTSQFRRPRVRWSLGDVVVAAVVAAIVVPLGLLADIATRVIVITVKLIPWVIIILGSYWLFQWWVS